MEITPIGVFLIVVGGALLLSSRADLLYWLAVFFVPFSSTAIVNVGSNGAYSGLQAWMFFGTLWIVSQTVSGVRLKNSSYRQQMRASTRKLIVFLLVAFCSLIMPLWIDGRLSIYFQSPLSNDAHPLVFSFQHVTQFLYLVFGVLFAIFVGLKNSHFVEFKKTLRVLLLSAIFVNCWGILQWFCYERGFDYPAFLFNTNKNEAAMGFSSEFSDLGISRISSVATEPSILAQYLLVVLVLVAFAVLGQQVILNKLLDRFALGLTLMVLLLTTSSTAYVGLAVLVPVFLFAFIRLGRMRPLRAALSLAALVICCLVVYARTSVVQDLADAVIFSKADSYSGLERLNSVILAAGYFVQYPILGVGWGSVTSHDLVFKLLADTGIAGLFAFCWFLKSLASGLWNSSSGMRMGPQEAPSSYWASCLLVAIFVLILTCAVSEFTYVFGPLWLVFGMSFATISKSAGLRGSPLIVREVHA